jgi:trypanothione synthetase/amidase
MLHSRREVVPFNQIQGIASTNVYAYSNGDEEFFPVEGHYYHGIFLGFKWECIEFARRWLLMRKTCIFPNILQAADMWHQLKTVERVTDGKQFPLILHLNGSLEKPKRDSLLIYPRSLDLPYGHIAIICDVIPGFIRVAEQNYEYYNWSDNYSREIPLIFKNNCYYIEDEHEVYGWMEIENIENLEPLDETKLDSILKQYQQTNPIGTLERCTIPNKNCPLSFSWLNENDQAEKLYMQAYATDLLRTDTNTFPYYKADQNLLLNIAGASNELHKMFLHATGYVLENDDLLRHFCIPEVFWSKIRQSWLNEKDLNMTGRFDLAFNGTQIKLFEYNADSAAALFEMSIILEKWAKKINFERTFMSGFQLHRILVKNWKKFQSVRRVHILIDDDQEELMTAYYMQTVLKEANIESKLCILTKDLYWKDSKIIDSDGYEVELVWKLWMWETVFSNYIQCEKQGILNKQINGEHPDLHQILLHDQIKVMEPLWKVITSNKAILPVLWLLYPNHPNLLQSEYALTNDLKQIPFVKKPIVGRAGHNVTLYDVNGESVLGETKGKFIDRSCIYQELFSLTKFDGYYPIIGSWIVNDSFAGFGIREDKKLITDADSPVTACSIVLK